MKRHLLLITAMLFSMASMFAQDCDYHGTTGTLEWCLKDGTLTISGEGEMPDYGYGETPWYEYRESVHTVVVETGVTTIGDWALGYCYNLTSITIPDGVTTIGEYAFHSCHTLTSITLPSGLTTIGAYAFIYWYSLTSITIPNSVTTIGGGAFLGCNHLSSITIPNSVTIIGNEAFGGCTNLTSINVANDNAHYSSDNGVLFNKDKTTLIRRPEGKTGDYIIPNSVTTIENQAFSKCSSLTSIILPSGVTTIGYYAFYGCNSLTSITLPSGITTIETGTFRNCSSLTSITFPSGLTTIEVQAFSDCISLTSITNMNLVPVNINLYVFENVDIGICTLRVPASAVSAYQNADVWQEFNIVGIYSVKVSVNNDKYGIVTGGGYYEPNVTVTLTATAHTGYKFAHWTKNGEIVSTENPYNFSVTEDVELVANFEIYLVNVSVNNEEYGTATGGGYYELNETVTITATAYTGYKFINWTKNGVEVSINNPYSFIVTEDVELVANFEEEVGIEDFELTTVKIYPNPTKSELKIESGELRVENLVIYDVFGKIQKIENGKMGNAIDISHLPAGVYFVEITTEVGKVMRKVLKE